MGEKQMKLFLDSVATRPSLRSNRKTVHVILDLSAPEKDLQYRGSLCYQAPVVHCTTLFAFSQLIDTVLSKSFNYLYYFHWFHQLFLGSQGF